MQVELGSPSLGPPQASLRFRQNRQATGVGVPLLNFVSRVVCSVYGTVAALRDLVGEATLPPSDDA